MLYSPLYWCDFDMFWTNKSDPITSGVLRAISGSTVYMSDELDQTNPDNITPICGKNYEYNRFDGAAMPTLDRVYENCLASGKFVKAFNHKNSDSALAVFNFVKEEKTETVSLCDIPTLSDNTDYISVEYFSKSFTRVKKSDTVSVTLPAESVAAYTFMPIMCDNFGEYIMLGDTDMYFPSMSIDIKKIYIKDLNV